MERNVQHEVGRHLFLVDVFVELAHAQPVHLVSRLDAANAKEMKVDETDKLLVGYMTYEEEMDTLRNNIVEGAGSRLRPILMSSLTTILGVVPMAIATGEGAEVYAPLGQVIMGGLATSTFITLFLMPMLYFTLERFKIKRILRRKSKETE